MTNDDRQPQNTPDPKKAGGEPFPAREDTSTDHIKELRERLYARDGVPERSMRHSLPRNEIHDYIYTPTQKAPVLEPEIKPTPRIQPEIHEHAPVPVQAAETPTVPYTVGMASKGRKKFRKMAMLGGLVFFILALAVSSLLMFSGNNTISGDNISIDTSGPIAVGGGEEFSFQVSVANQNAVPIQSATLIIEYPKGTQSITEPNKEISIERQQLNTIADGELVNIPIKARVFGEENEEKEIKVSIDYRVAGSNATFHKESTPLRFKVSTSPVVIVIDAVKSISSGQEIDLDLTIQSNSPTPLSDILVKVAYPAGFDFTSAKPDTVSGEDTWKFNTLKPNEKQTISIKGLLIGGENETRTFSATAGVANERDKNTLASQLANARADVVIEQPFLDVGVTVNGSDAETVIINNDESANVTIRYENKLDTAIYDGKITVELGGNALSEVQVNVTNGFYDSSKNTITWDGGDESSLREISPGRSSVLQFALSPREDIGRTPELTLKVTAEGQRKTFESNVSENLVGIVNRTIKVESIPKIEASALYSSGPFRNTGPTPPVAEKVTQYTYMLLVKSGANAITGGEVTAVVPQYMTWLDLVTDGDNVTYNATTRTMKWTVGDMEANTVKDVGIQVSFLPSLSQVGTSPTILEVQRFKATDRFTGTVVRAEHAALTTNLYTEEDADEKDGRVEAR